jgi:hypothetical protein
MYNMNFYFVVFFIVCGGKLIFYFFSDEKKCLRLLGGIKKGRQYIKESTADIEKDKSKVASYNRRIEKLLPLQNIKEGFQF